MYYPDTLLVAHRTSAIKPDRFILEAVCWSMSQQAVVTVGEADMVCYSYANLKVRSRRQVKLDCSCHHHALTPVNVENEHS